MKQVCLFILLLISGSGYAQIKIDFSKKTIEVPSREKLQQQKEVQIIVENIPTTAYKVSINKTDSFVSAGTPPPMFNTLNFGDGFNSLLSGLAGYTIRNAGNMLANTTELKKEKKKDDKEFKLFDFEQETFKDESVLDFFSQRVCVDSVNYILPRIKEMRKKVFDFHFQFRDDVIRKAEKLMYDVNLNRTDSTSFKTTAEGIINDRFKLEKELETSYREYYDDILPKYTAVTKCIPLAAADSMLTSYKKSFFQFLNKFDTTFNEALIVKVFKQLKAPAPVTTFTSLPYRLKGDITKFTIDISGTDPAKTPQSYNTVVELEKHPNRLWSFTSGVFISNLVNHDFSILTNVRPNAQNPLKNDTLNYSILQEKNNRISAGINALMHIGGYFDEGKETGAYLAFGPGLTLEKTPQVRAFIGAGFMFGRTNKLALSFGWTGGLVKRLSSNYSLNKTYTPAPADITRDRFKGGGFVSLSYSILGK
jgi:hypothetical protein